MYIPFWLLLAFALACIGAYQSLRMTIQTLRSDVDELRSELDELTGDDED
jgi:hypothetical protein